VHRAVCAHHPPGNRRSLGTVHAPPSNCVAARLSHLFRYHLSWLLLFASLSLSFVGPQLLLRTPKRNRPTDHFSPPDAGALPVPPGHLSCPVLSCPLLCYCTAPRFPCVCISGSLKTRVVFAIATYPHASRFGEWCDTGSCCVPGCGAFQASRHLHAATGPKAGETITSVRQSLAAASVTGQA
jgi:hypothetical protein